MTAKHKKSKLARAMAKLHIVIDKFHFGKGHSGCRENGTSPLPAVWPKTHAASFGKFNDSAAEQAFAFVRRIAVAARRMSPVRGLLFVLLLQHARNENLEAANIHKESKKRTAHAPFQQQRAFHSMAEARLFSQN